MKISIITATYNAADTLEDAANSLFAQTYPDTEYVIVDGSSNETTADKVRSFGKKVDLFIHEADQGIYDAINKGIENSTGDIVGLLHADDMFAGPRVLEKVAQSIMHSSCDAVYGDLQYVKRTHLSKVIRHWKSTKFNASLINRGWMPPHPTLFIRRELFLKHGPYNLSYRIAADYDFMLSLLTDQQLKISYIPEVLVKMRTGGTSNRSLSDLIHKSREDLQIMRSHQLPFPLFSLFNKNFSKISQFFRN